MGATAALELLAPLDAAALHAHGREAGRRFLASLDLPAADSAIATVDLVEAADRLAPSGVRASARAGRVRASLHLHDGEQDADTAVAALTGGRSAHS